MKNTTLTITALLAALSTGALAQTTGNPDTTAGTNSPAGQNFDTYDANRDGMLDENEASENNVGNYRDMDRDGNETVDREEFDAWHREQGEANRDINDQ